MNKTCPCGKIFFVKTYLLHRKKYCCKVCFYKYHGRKSGLTYKIVKENPTSFKKGQKPWNTGLAGKKICKPNNGSIKLGERRGINTEFKKGDKPSKNRKIHSGVNHSNWKGDDASYGSIHHWVYRHFGKAKICENCGENKKMIHWSNKDHNYKRVIKDWQSLCVSCHKKYDKQNN